MLGDIYEESAEGGSKRRRKKKDLVYFNSNQFHGGRYIDEQSAKAMNSIPLPANDQLQSQITGDGNKILRDAEALLLRTIIRIPSARLAMKAALTKSYIPGSSASLIEWSSPEREWLFECLVNATEDQMMTFSDETNEHDCPIDKLWTDLKNRADAPLGAFGDLPLKSRVGPSTNIESGSLDELFSKEYDIIDPDTSASISSEELKVELTLQRSVSIILKATAMTKLDSLKREWAEVENERIRREGRDNKEPLQQSSTTTNIAGISSYASLDDDDLKKMGHSLAEQVFEAFKNVNSLTESTKRLSSRIMDRCQTYGSSIEGRMSADKREKLIKMLDEHVASLRDNS